MFGLYFEDYFMFSKNKENKENITCLIPILFIFGFEKH